MISRISSTLECGVHLIVPVPTLPIGLALFRGLNLSQEVAPHSQHKVARQPHETTDVKKPLRESPDGFSRSQTSTPNPDRGPVSLPALCSRAFSATPESP